jgi:hypothetical protein
MTDNRIDPKWVINRQGKDFVLFAGLLDLAHRSGLRGITTSIAQIGDATNGQRHVVLAVADMGDGRQFCGIGDADPSNVSKMILPSALRMAETRAKARALRDAVNVAMVSIEELPPEDDRPTRSRASAPDAELEPTTPAPKPKGSTDPVAMMKKQVAEALKARGIHKDDMAKQVATIAEHLGVEVSNADGLQAILDFIRSRP